MTKKKKKGKRTCSMTCMTVHLHLFCVLLKRKNSPTPRPRLFMFKSSFQLLVFHSANTTHWIPSHPRLSNWALNLASTLPRAQLQKKKKKKKNRAWARKRNRRSPVLASENDSMGYLAVVSLLLESEWSCSRTHNTGEDREMCHQVLSGKKKKASSEAVKTNDFAFPLSWIEITSALS